jgi:hypothetical protein
MKKSIPPAPPGWNKTIADLFDEMNSGKRATVGSPETDWARDYERSQIPAGMRFPRKGDIYEALEDMTVRYLTAWKAPRTGGGEGVLRNGDRVVVDSEPIDSKPIGVYGLEVDYDSLEERIVPASVRGAPKYSGFYFSFKTVELNRKFKLVHEDTH